jgi:hypothetical protein
MCLLLEEVELVDVDLLFLPKWQYQLHNYLDLLDLFVV